jgi:hypothetical protein
MRVKLRDEKSIKAEIERLAARKAEFVKKADACHLDEDGVDPTGVNQRCWDAVWKIEDQIEQLEFALRMAVN